MQIFVSTKSHLHVRQVRRQLICLILNLGLLHWLLVVLVRSAHHYKQCSEVQLLNRGIRCGVGWCNPHVYISLHGLCWRTLRIHTSMDYRWMANHTLTSIHLWTKRLFKLKPFSEIGITVNQVEVPFSEAYSSNCFDLCDVVILMTSAFSVYGIISFLPCYLFQWLYSGIIR